MVDKQENILVELDYDNISLIDPNKVIDEDGNVSDRLVRQEDLVMYANLECNVLPRTKLAVGSAMNDSSRTISVGKINFLNPGHKTFLNTAWSDELTGKDTLTGQGVNQPKQTAVKNPNKSDDYYIKQNLYSNGTPGAVDNGLLGMKSIKLKIDT
jgi:5-methylcytosine-specific restriction endonuclease McrBC GTP-binding regulatory subunit McrB